MKNPELQMSRRRFLLAASAATAATGAAVASRNTARPPGTDAKAQSKTGYQVTEHVRNYYRTAKI